MYERKVWKEGGITKAVSPTMPIAFAKLHENEVMQSLTIDLGNRGVTATDQLFPSSTLVSGEKQKGLVGSNIPVYQ